MTDFFGDFSWPTFISLLPAYLGALASVVLLALTFREVRNAREEAESRAAFEFFLNEAKDPVLMRARNDFIALRKSFPDVMDVMGDFEKYESEQNTLRYTLNRYETLSAGILHHGISESFAHLMWRGTFMSDWKYLVPFIIEIQEISGNGEIGRQFNTLAKLWGLPEDEAEEFFKMIENKS